MARQTGPVCKLCRREGKKLFLKGEKCFTNCTFEKRSYPPGQHGQQAEFRRRRSSDYTLQLRAKQQARRVYGVLERQFRRYLAIAEGREGLTAENLLTVLEQRLDNVVYRLGLADSRPQARQLVQHGHILVNGHKLDIPSYLVKPEDVVSVKQQSRRTQYFRDRRELLGQRAVPAWLSFNEDELSGRVMALPSPHDLESLFEEQLIVEYYSR
jgi:small subunit ribosomal protein S4